MHSCYFYCYLYFCFPVSHISLHIVLLKPLGCKILILLSYGALLISCFDPIQLADLSNDILILRIRERRQFTLKILEY